MKSEALHLTLVEAGLSDQADEITALVRPSIRLSTTCVSQEDLPIGASRLGGAPDIPSDLRLPGTLSFIAQINLRDAAPYDFEGLLPHEGWLYFFYDTRKQPDGSRSSHRLGWHILYFDGDVSQLAVRGSALLERFPGPFPFPYQPCKLTFAPELTLPYPESKEVDDLGLSWDERYSNAVFGMMDRNAHRLLGHPDLVQGEMRFDCARGAQGLPISSASDPDSPAYQRLAATLCDWVLVLQVTEDAHLGATFGDAGTLYYWMRRQDLRDQQFASVWAMVQST